MPGILAIISRRPAGECQSALQAMVSSMLHESFYTHGVWSAPELGIYTGWVAMKGSFADGQVFLNESQNVALILSGECFLDNQTKENLRARGHELGSKPASWLVHLYEEEGESFVSNLNGLFSGILIDIRRGKVFVFNDRYAIERLYFAETSDAFYLASEAKALLRVLPESREFDPDGLGQYLGFGCTFGTRTLFRHVEMMPGGSCWTFEGGAWRRAPYFSPDRWESQGAIAPEAFADQLQEIFTRIVPRYFHYDSRIGISLTAGLDTRMIMACMPKLPASPICYTFGGVSGETLDARIAARVAKACGLEHRLLRIGSDFFADFAQLSERTVFLTDGCFGIAGAHEIYMNAQARALAPVRLTGNYGGEIFRGVSTFKPQGLNHSLFHPELARTIHASIVQFSGGEAHPVTFSAFKEIPWNLFGNLMAGRSQLGFRSPYLDNEVVSLAYRAPSDTRSSRKPGLRFVKRNDSLLGQIPTDKGDLGEASGVALTLRRLFAAVSFKLDYLNNEGFPHVLSRLDPVIGRLGFGLGVFGLHKHLHYRTWFRRELAGYVKDRLNMPALQRSSLWNSGFLDHLGEDHLLGRKNYAQEINAVLTIEAIERLLFKELPRKVHPAPEALTEKVSMPLLKAR